MPTLIETAESKISDFDYSNHEWVTFVRDHKKNLFLNSTVIDISAPDMQTYRYRFPALIDFIGVNENISWIIMEMNSIKSARDIININKLTIPNNDYIELLLQRFNTYQLSVKAASQ